MTLHRTATFLILASTTAAFAQSKKPVHHSAATAHKSTVKAGATTGIPKVAGVPKTLYALKYIDLKTGTGPLAEPRKWYTVKYTGWLPDGTKFDSSDDHPGKAPIVFPYGAHQVIPGWDTGFEGMHVGGKRRLIIPYQLAYGEAGRPPVIPAKSVLTFDLELVGFADTPPAAPKPPTPAPAPAGPAKPTAPGATTPPATAAPATAAPAATTPPASPASTPTSAPAPDAKPGATPPVQTTTPDAQPKAATPPQSK